MKTKNRASASMALAAELAMDGELVADEEALLTASLEADPALASEHLEYRRLQQALVAEKVEVRPDFCAQVMGNLPVASWEPSLARAWVLPLAAMLVFALGSSFLLAAAEWTEGSSLGTGIALFDFLQTTAMAGAGLVAATWRGAGFGLDQLFAESGVNLAVLAAGVLMLNLLFFRMLRRSRLAISAHAGPKRSHGRES
jgi:anti-sigma factor RsiW